MSPYEQVKELLQKTESGEKELGSFYELIWKNAFLLKSDQLTGLLGEVEKLGFGEPMAETWFTFSKGYLYTFFPNMGNAYEKMTEALELFRKNGDVSGTGAAQSILAVYFKNAGQLDRAQTNIQQAVQNIDPKSIYQYFLVISFYQAGEIHHLLKDHEAAIGYFNKGLEASGNNIGMAARVLNGKGTVHLDKGEYEEAFRCFNESLKQIEGSNNFLLESKNYADIGNYYSHKGDLERSLEYQQKSLKIRLDKNLSNPLITNYIELAELFQKQGKHTEALGYAILAEKLSRELNIIIKLYQAHRVLSSVYEALGNSTLALQHYKEYNQLKEEVHSQESARKIKQISMQHEVEIFRLRNVELKSALDEIGESMRYARRIQQAILPPEKLVKRYLPDNFILYRPKDIVAGDFYWIETTGDKVMFAVADCTGHGVPGALVSVVCHNALNRAVREFGLSNAGLILNKVRELVIGTFEKSEEEVKDGMDIALCVLNTRTLEAEYAGANNPLWIIKNGKAEERPADKQPIGKYQDEKPFSNHSLQLKKGDTIVLFSDGYADQFGGPRGKKFKYKPLQELLISMSAMPMEKQQAKLENVFEEWKGGLEQVDDVCIFGVRV